jgi:hypothetical protein
MADFKDRIPADIKEQIKAEFKAMKPEGPTDFKSILTELAANIELEVLNLRNTTVSDEYKLCVVTSNMILSRLAKAMRRTVRWM